MQVDLNFPHSIAYLSVIPHSTSVGLTRWNYLKLEREWVASQLRFRSWVASSLFAVLKKAFDRHVWLPHSLCIAFSDFPFGFKACHFLFKVFGKLLESLSQQNFLNRSFSGGSCSPDHEDLIIVFLYLFETDGTRLVWVAAESRILLSCQRMAVWF